MHVNIVTDLINVLPGNSSVNTVQHATIEEAVFRVRSDVTRVGSDHVICGACPFRGYISKQFLARV
jgi:hypothetical protein